jgi:hypothetical protein
LEAQAVIPALVHLEKGTVFVTTYDRFASYLKDRKQRVDIDGHLSTEFVFNISVIQGSILGPIFFLIYINDLYSASDLFKVMFADDTAGLACDDSLPNLFSFVNNKI